MDFTVRVARKDDMPQVMGLIQELADFEKESHEVELTVADLQHDGFEKEKKFHCFVAEHKGGVVAMALVYPRYSTWKGTVIHLEDLIVKEEFRGNGMGRALLDEVIKYGDGLGVKRICWEVLDWNTPAIDFYKSKGARILEGWQVVHLNREAIDNYMNGL